MRRKTQPCWGKLRAKCKLKNVRTSSKNTGPKTKLVSFVKKHRDDRNVINHWLKTNHNDLKWSSAFGQKFFFLYLVFFMVICKSASLIDGIIEISGIFFFVCSHIVFTALQWNASLFIEMTPKFGQFERKIEYKHTRARKSHNNIAEKSWFI